MSLNVTFRVLVGAGILALGALITNADLAKADTPKIQSDVDASTLPDFKATPLGLYLTPEGAHQALTKNPDILFIDVRDPIEVTFVGHAEGLDKVIPVGVATHDVDPETGQHRMVANNDFITQVDAFVAAQGKAKTDPIFVSCRSGARSAVAATKLIDAGYTNVWNLVEGFEGDKAKDGTRDLNGWRNAGLPWRYKLAPGVAWQN